MLTTKRNALLVSAVTMFLFLAALTALADDMSSSVTSNTPGASKRDGESLWRTHCQPCHARLVFVDDEVLPKIKEHRDVRTKLSPVDVEAIGQFLRSN